MPRVSNDDVQHALGKLEILLFSDNEGKLETTLEYQSFTDIDFATVSHEMFSVLESGGDLTKETELMERIPLADVAGMLVSKLVADNWTAITDMALRSKGLDPADYSVYSDQGPGTTVKTGGGIRWN